VPARTSLVVVGDVDRQEVLKTLEDLFGRYQATGLPEPPMPEDGPPDKNIVINETSKFTVSQAYLGYLGPSVKNKPDVYQIDLLTFLIGMGKNSLLSKAFKAPEKNIDISAEYLTQAYPGMITISAYLPPGQEPDAISKMEAVIKDVQDGKFSDKDLTRARTLLVNTYSFGKETNAGKAGDLGFYEAIDTSDYAIHYVENINKITKQQVMDAAKKYLGRPHVQLVMKATQPKKGNSRA
jgi:predicted Zn-dependent peptidase